MKKCQHNSLIAVKTLPCNHFDKLSEERFLGIQMDCEDCKKTIRVERISKTSVKELPSHRSAVERIKIMYALTKEL